MRHCGRGCRPRRRIAVGLGLTKREDECDGLWIRKAGAGQRGIKLLLMMMIKYIVILVRMRGGRAVMRGWECRRIMDERDREERVCV